MLGYESLNFVEGLGSIIIFAFIQILFILIVLIITTTKCKCPTKWAKRTFTKKQACLNSIDFINGTFFEILVCVSVSTFMLYISEYLNVSDKVSLVLMGTFFLILVANVLYILYFTFLQAPKWVESK